MLISSFKHFIVQNEPLKTDDYSETDDLPLANIIGSNEMQEENRLHIDQTDEGISLCFISILF